MVLLLIALPMGALMPWKRGDIGAVLARLWWAAAGALALGGIVWGMQGGGRLLAPVGLALAAWVLLGVLVEILERSGLPRVGLGTALARIGRMPRADWGKLIAHAGMGLSVMGIAAVTAWEVEDIRLARPGDSIPLAGYEIRFDDVSQGQGPNYLYERGRFTVTRGGETVAVLEPEKRSLPGAGAADDRGGDRFGARPRYLRRAGRPADQRGSLGDPGLCQAAGQLDLARGAGDGPRRAGQPQ